MMGGGGSDVWAFRSQADEVQQMSLLCELSFSQKLLFNKRVELLRSFHLCGGNQAVTRWSDVRLTAVAGAAARNPLAFIIESSNGRRSCRNVGAQASPCCEIALFTEQPLLKKPGITQPFFKLSHSSLRTAAGRCRRVSRLMVHRLWGGLVHEHMSAFFFWWILLRR